MHQRGGGGGRTVRCSIYSSQVSMTAVRGLAPFLLSLGALDGIWSNQFERSRPNRTRRARYHGRPEKCTQLSGPTAANVVSCLRELAHGESGSAWYAAVWFRVRETNLRLHQGSPWGDARERGERLQTSTKTRFDKMTTAQKTFNNRVVFKSDLLLTGLYTTEREWSRLAWLVVSGVGLDSRANYDGWRAAG
ncbi:uncharacterized protein LY79DRAFT_355516 [Colletotrichum navitas]|uniref:Uncharacterized protein n=1 Tax=Colletotrichum navitas TaxID=681940 RepID=A0AAD8V9Z8_9PEZI|nr:uncharacterized protein LY79DRAFT_355516 [Colletotrichum navitas]KAK1597753.1 hypothetical protein LY79DRAFT_355516 [Colletotrichum navitas]